MTIPSPFPDSLDAALDVYLGLGLAIHPCYRPDEGRASERGKKPRFQGWKLWTAADFTPATRREFFDCERPSNVGCVVRSPLVVVDLDSKPDEGRSVVDWLDAHPDLAAVPRERTGGGAHLWFRCRDLPDFKDARGNPYEKNLAAKLNDAVTAELIFSGNVIISPSIHPSGATYRWQVTGEIPYITWAQLQDTFGFRQPDAPKAKKEKEAPWWAAYAGDLRTLDLVGLAQELGIHGELLDPDKRTHSARCPWAAEHAEGGRDWTARQTDTVIFEGAAGQMPGFHCLHSHCSERGLAEFLAWAEGRAKGVVDRHCEAKRVWSPGQRSSDGVRGRILLPGMGRPDSIFATEAGGLIGRKHSWFSFADNPVVIRESAEKTATSAGLRIHMLKPVEAITEVERHVEVGVLRKDEAGDSTFVPLSMSEACARILLAAPQLRESLPLLRRVLDVSLPILTGGNLVYPAPGYDPRFGTFLATDAPEISYMSLDEARALILDDLLGDKDSGGFCWTDDQSKCHAVARIITPFCRGLMAWARPPLWIVEANRERCGKDFYAQIPCLLYLGRKVIFAPPTKDSDEEMRKRITTALMANARMIHLANVKGHVRFAALEAATDNTGVWQDRILGGNAEACLPNEAEFSFSANAGTTWEPDIEGRSRRIRLHYDKEEINARTFRHPDLHEWVLANRSRLLSACAAFVAEWDRQGRPAGPTPFSSFPQWARVVGGVMHSCGLGDPCLPHSDESKITGDQNTEAMKMLFALAHEHFGNDFIKKSDLVEFIAARQDNGLLEWIDLKSRAGCVQLGKILNKFVRRELGGVRLDIPQTGKNNVLYRFQGVSKPPAEGISGISGISAPATHSGQNDQLPKVIEREGVVYKALADIPEFPDIPAPVESASEFDRIAEEIASAEAPVALDIETYNESGGGGALSPFAPGAQIRLLTLAVPGRNPWIIDLRATGYDLGELGRVIEGGEVIGHNLKFDLLWLRQKCRLNPRRVFCTMTASRLLTAGSKEPNDLGAVIARHLGLRLPKDQARSDWGGMVLTADQLAYSVNDVAHLHALRAKLDEALTAAGLTKVAELEMALSPVVVDMEAAGFPVDRAAFEAMASKAEGGMAAAMGRVRDAVGDPHINPASPAQLLAALNRLGIPIEDTSAEVLAAVDHPAARAILEYRDLEKTAQQARALLKAAGADGRIHARFEPTGTITGRFSSKEPNLQQIKRGEMRTAFRAPEGKALIVADYSQIELRAVASLAADPVMLDAFRQDVDLHRKTAALFLGKPESQVSKDERQTAKACFSGDTEILTQSGWVRFDQYDGVAPVAQYALPSGVQWNPPRARSNRWGHPTGKVHWDGKGAVEFVQPLDFRSFDDREVVRQLDRNSDLLVTPDHEIAFLSGTGNPRKVRADQVAAGNCRHLIAAGHLPRAPLLSEKMTRALAMVVADGSFVSERVVRFGFTKERKMRRCIEILMDLRLVPRVSVIGHLCNISVCNEKFVGGLLRWVTPDKHLSWDCLEHLDGAAYLDEAAYWDSHILHGKLNRRILFSTTSQQTANVMQAMAATSGIPSTLKCRSSKKTGRLNVYSLSYRLGGSPLWRASWNLKPAAERQTVFCVQVPSGAILIRRNGKVSVQGNCNFGLIYGQSAPGLVRYARSNYGVVMSEEEAQVMRQRFFAAYRGIAAWHKQAWRRASEIAGVADCCAHTALGRRRLMPLGGEDWPRFTTLVNTPIQGTCGDGMKMAMVRIGALLPPGAEMIATIHDELVLLADQADAEAVKALVVEEMQAAMAALLPDVPIEVEAGVCTNWGEKA